jgi:hypothetical protein
MRSSRMYRLRPHNRVTREEVIISAKAQRILETTPP